MAAFLEQARVAIVGLGQLGGSLGLRLRQLGCHPVLGVSRRADTLADARARGAIDGGSTAAAEVLPLADLVILCQPLSATVAFVRQHLEQFRPASVVTDVGSVKGMIVKELREPLAARGVAFVGGHPMAGSEKSGLAQARADLFAGCVCFLTPTPADDPDAVSGVARVWRELGACVLEVDAARHDAAVAFASHLPHLTAAAVVRAVLGQGDREAQQWACASGFRDTTRVASGNVEMWTEIGRHNAPAILSALAALQGELAAVRQLLEAEDWVGLAAFLASAKTARDDWQQVAAARRAATGQAEGGDAS